MSLGAVDCSRVDRMTDASAYAAGGCYQGRSQDVCLGGEGIHHSCSFVGLLG